MNTKTDCANQFDGGQLRVRMALSAKISLEDPGRATRRGPSKYKNKSGQPAKPAWRAGPPYNILYHVI